VDEKVKDNKRHSDPNKTSPHEENRKISGDVHVRGEVEVDFAKTLIDEYVSTRKDGSDQEKKHYRLAKITLLVGIAYAGLTTWLAVSSQESATAASSAAKASVASYEATARPYAFPTLIAKVEDKPPNLKVNVVLKNYGTIPAEQVMFDWVVIVNGIAYPAIREVPELPHELPPGETTTMVGQIGIGEAPRVLNGTDKAIVYVTYSYRWRDKQENGCQKYQYYPPAHVFGDIGPVCYPK
jgi:hypothetical protein